MFGVKVSSSKRGRRFVRSRDAHTNTKEILYMSKIGKFIFVLFSVFAVSAFADVSNPPDVKLKNPPALENKDSFSMILLGDPQTYSKFSFSQPIFELMTAWTAAHKDVLNIKLVLCTGDLVEHNGMLTKFNPKMKSETTNVPSALQWESTARAFSRLDGVLPYVLCTGNHDYGFYCSENRDTQFAKYFPITKNLLWRDCLVETAPDSHGIMTLENAAYEFDLPNWGKVLVISLEFAPRDESIDWAKKLMTSERYKNHKVILLTHSILRVNKKEVAVIQTEKYKLQPRNYAEAVLKRLADDSDNLKLVLCGHSGRPNRMSGNIDYTNAKGRKIPLVLFNPQSCGGWHGNGGDGWLRIMEFMPDGKTVSMRTYSPLFAASERTQDLSWNRDSDNEFRLVLE